MAGAALALLALRSPLHPLERLHRGLGIFVPEDRPPLEEMTDGPAEAAFKGVLQGGPGRSIVLLPELLREQNEAGKIAVEKR